MDFTKLATRKCTYCNISDIILTCFLHISNFLFARSRFLVTLRTIPFWCLKSKYHCLADFSSQAGFTSGWLKLVEPKKLRVPPDGSGWLALFTLEEPVLLFPELTSFKIVLLRNIGTFPYPKLAKLVQRNFLFPLNDHLKRQCSQEQAFFGGIQDHHRQSRRRCRPYPKIDKISVNSFNNNCQQ